MGPRYLVVKSFLTQEKTANLLSRSKQLLEEFDIESHPKVRLGCALCVAYLFDF